MKTAVQMGAEKGIVYRMPNLQVELCVAFFPTLKQRDSAIRALPLSQLRIAWDGQRVYDASDKPVHSIRDLVFTGLFEFDQLETQLFEYLSVGCRWPMFTADDIDWVSVMIRHADRCPIWRQ